MSSCHAQHCRYWCPGAIAPLYWSHTKTLHLKLTMLGNKITFWKQISKFLRVSPFAWPLYFSTRRIQSGSWLNDTSAFEIAFISLSVMLLQFNLLLTENYGCNFECLILKHTCHWRYITMMSHHCHGILSQQQLCCLFNSLYQANYNENIKAPRCWSLCGEFTCPRWIPHTKGQ